jgi:hypothetical protein
MLVEQVDGQITLGRAHHHPGHDSIVRIRRSVRPLRPPVPGRRRHIPVHPVGEGLGRFSLNGLEIEGVSGSFAFNGVGVDPVLEVTETGGHVI